MKSTKSNTNRQILLRLLSYMKPYRWILLAIFLMVLLINGTSLLQPYVLKLVTDSYLIPGQWSLNGVSILMIGIIYFVLMLIGNTMQYLQTLLMTGMGQKILKTIRLQLFETIQRLPLSYLDKTSSGRLITRATNDVEALGDFYAGYIIMLVRDFVLIIGIILAMVLMNLKLALLSFIVVPLMALTVAVISRMMHKNWQKLKAIQSKLNGSIAENISGMKLIQSFQAQKQRKEAFDELNQDYYKRGFLQVMLNAFMRPSANIFESIAIGLLLWYGGRQMGFEGVEIGTVIAFSTYIRQFFQPVTDISEILTELEGAFVSSDRIFQILDEQPILEDPQQGIVLPEVKGEVEFQDVWFRYDEEWILKGVSFKAPARSTLAIVGETGSGKTTIISLLSGFYPIEKGRILIDGVDIRLLKKSFLRRIVAVVLQDVFLFSGTILENITLNDKISKETVDRALQQSYSEIIIDRSPLGVEQPVMERGATFSSGERQLISFARALAHEPDIFVLDEATANIDSLTEGLIQQAIAKVSEDHTTIIIAHRLSTIREADTILVLEKGQVIEQGSHEELMAQGGHYRTLVEKGFDHDQGTVLE